MTQSSRPLAVLILAAGLGTRMQSARPKVLHCVAGRPLIAHVLAAVAPLQPASIGAVIGANMDDVRACIAPYPCIIQDPPLGTGDAVKKGLTAVPHAAASDLLIVLGDVPLITTHTLEKLAANHRSDLGRAMTLVAFETADPTGYGRLMLGPAGSVTRIVEQNEASPTEQAITLCNSGIMMISGEGLAETLARLAPSATGEFYLTDLVALYGVDGRTVGHVMADDAEVAGVNTRAQLAAREREMQRRLRERALAGGVTLVDPDTTYLSADTVLGRDVIIGPHVVIGEKVIIEHGTEIRAFSHLEGVHVGEHCRIGPFARLRPGTVLAPHVQIGNFVEIKNTQIGSGTKANHLTYLGDSVIGSGCNLGAGTITCNYDGFSKYTTTIGDNVFVGSHGTLVAPLTLADGAYIAAGSVITDDVPQDSLSIARSRQVTKHGWADKFRHRKI